MIDSTAFERLAILGGVDATSHVELDRRTIGESFCDRLDLSFARLVHYRRTGRELDVRQLLPVTGERTQ